jgi:hypothetical protein
MSSAVKSLIKVVPFPGTLTVSRGLTNILGSLFLSEIVGPNILINVSFIFL